MRTLKSEFTRLGLLQARTGEVDRKYTKTSTKRKERMTDRELRDLMGVHRDTYKRVSGRIRRK